MRQELEGKVAELSTGLAGSEAELASVLAHEIGHVTARHAAQRHQRAAAIQVSGKLGELNQDPSTYVQGYSREQELDADTLGIRYLARAGYDPQAMSSFLKKLDAHAKLEAGLMGLAADQTCRRDSFCAHTIARDEVMVVHDALQDPRFAANPLVTGAPHIRFYAGAPLVLANGHAVGTLCVIDQSPKHLTTEQKEALQALARQVSALL